MVKKTGEMEKELKELMRGGKGTVEVTHIFKQDELKGKCRLCATLTINPGCSIGLHEHVGEEEIFYIISGSGIFNDNGEQKRVTAGEGLLTVGGEKHSIENDGDHPLVLMAVILLY